MTPKKRLYVYCNNSPKIRMLESDRDFRPFADALACTIEYLSTRYYVRHIYDRFTAPGSKRDNEILFEVYNNNTDVIWVYFYYGKTYDSQYLSIEVDDKYVHGIRNSLKGFYKIVERGNHPTLKLQYRNYDLIQQSLVFICDAIDEYFKNGTNSVFVSKDRKRVIKKEHIHQDTDRTLSFGGLQKGMRIKHARFGEGVVKSIVSEDNRQVIIFDFDDLDDYKGIPYNESLKSSITILSDNCGLEKTTEKNNVHIPPRHLSVRVPWKDNGYTGNVCNKPCNNTACLRLKNIAENKNDEDETLLAGQTIKGNEKRIPCVAEGACFMSSESYSTTTIHPYKESNPTTHGHFLETELIFPPFSFPCRPFGWLMQRKSGERGSANIIRLIDRYGIDYKEEREPNLSFETNWVQDAVNQRAVFKTFYEDVIPNKSLIIPYAKQVPFVEDPRRVVMGIGLVDSITEPPEHNHTDDGDLRSSLWETMIAHTIRDDRKNGFLMPYREMMAYSAGHPEFDMSSIVVYAEDDFFDEFSFATEHVSFDAVISVLLQCIKSLKIIKNHISGNWGECITWLEEQLQRAWLDRGPFPGLSTMLQVAKFKYSELMVKDIRKALNGSNEYEYTLIKVLEDPDKYFSYKVRKVLSSTNIMTFLHMQENRKNLFWLLSRMSLTYDQAISVFNLENRNKLLGDGFITDEEILENPYLLYEKTRLLPVEEQIPLNTIDRAVYPSPVLRDICPLSKPTKVDFPDDGRRIRAYLVKVLEECADAGHTLYPAFHLVERINNLPLDPPFEISTDTLFALEDKFSDEVVPRKINGVENDKGYQLLRLKQMDDVIRRAVHYRIKGQRFDIKENWGLLLDQAFQDKKYANEEIKKQQRVERVAILQELAASQLSVLTGGAGTGKTSLLSILCKSPEIQTGKVLLLAPTGKARVRLSQAMSNQGISATAKTIAQFLVENNRFDGRTMRYCLSKKPALNVPKTVIIDESSMLTEEMFAALLEALVSAERIIFAGDRSQLPPIGSGHPFVDLINSQSPEKWGFPRVSQGIGELTITMRQYSEDGKERVDTELAKWYSHDPEGLDDSVFFKLESLKSNKNIEFKRWTSPEELEELILDTIVQETRMKDGDDILGFNFSLGGYINNGWINFARDEESIRKIESWQVLSAYRSDPAIGTSTINRIIHDRYKHSEYKQLPNGNKIRATRHVLGSESICYGDKVINIRNQKKDGNYVANGEVGIVDRVYERPQFESNKHRVRFTSQPENAFFWFSGISDEGNADLELAYALTVHKSQGSEFDTVILVLGEPGRMINRELLYTALTRQKNRIVILYNDDLLKLRDYSLTEYSSVANRYTCLFKTPTLVNHKGRFYEEKLIHKTLRGELVRSKSEVIIANELYNRGINYEYEQDLVLSNGERRSPDFTIEVKEKRTTYYWEHLGMMSDPSYRQRWEKKKKLYAENGIIEGKNLLVSQDGLDGSFDSSQITSLINIIVGDDVDLDPDNQ